MSRRAVIPVVGGCAWGALVLACSSLPNVTYDDADAASRDATGDQPNSETSSGGTEGGMDGPAKPDVDAGCSPPSGAICCGNLVCIGCAQVDCPACTAAACGGGTVCCQHGGGLMCKVDNACH